MCLKHGTKFQVHIRLGLPKPCNSGNMINTTMYAKGPESTFITHCEPVFRQNLNTSIWFDPEDAKVFSCLKILQSGTFSLSMQSPRRSIICRFPASLLIKHKRGAFCRRGKWPLVLATRHKKPGFFPQDNLQHDCLTLPFIEGFVFPPCFFN